MRWIFGAMASLLVVGCGGDKSGSRGPQFSCDKVQPAGFPTTAEGQEVDDTLADLSFTDSQSNDRCTRDFTGKVVFISIGAGWCPPCQAETPGFVDVYGEFKSDGLEIIQVMFDSYDVGGAPDQEFLDEWTAEYDIPFILVGDPGNDFWETYVPPSNTGYIPHNIIVNRDGVVEFTNYGSMPENTLRTRINALIDDPPALEYP